MKARVLFILISIGCFGQNNFEKAKDNDTGVVSIWAFKQKKVKVNGLSVGVADFSDDEEKSIVNGLKIELIGMGILFFLIPKSPIVEDASLLEDYRKNNDIQQVNGFSLSGSGSICDCLINGVSAGYIGQLNYKVNGFSVSAAMNFAQIHNGIQVAMFNESFKTNGLQTGISNGSYKMNGAQIGLVNGSDDFKGLQIGLVNKSKSQTGLQIGLFNFTNKIKGLQLGFWNVNTKRSLPILNF
jgi:hypothetical protein